MEAVFQGIPAVAFSEGTGDGYLVTDRYLENVLAEVIDTPFTERQIVNVNFPNCDPDEMKGILWDRICSVESIFHDTYTWEEMGEGKRRYRVNGMYNEDVEEGSDLRALFDHYISIGMLTNIH